MILRNISWRLTMVPLTGLLLALGAPAGAQTTHHPSKRVKFGHLASGPNAVSQDFGDVAVIVDETVTAEEVLKEIRAAGGSLLSEARLFDLYRRLAATRPYRLTRDRGRRSSASRPA